MRALEGLTDLKELILDHFNPALASHRLASDNPAGPRLDDDGLVHLGTLTQLTALSLAGTEIGDAGLVHLKGLTRLTSLNLTGTRVTDASLAVIRGLPKLQFVGLNGTQVTHEGVVALTTFRPGLDIQSDFNVVEPPRTWPFDSRPSEAPSGSKRLACFCRVGRVIEAHHLAPDGGPR